MPRPFLISSLLLLVMVTGCLYEIRDEVNDFHFQMKNHMKARYSWWQVESCYMSLDHRRDFKRGFLAGYEGSAFGGNGCPPSLPPPLYWKACFATPEGKERANAWFDGYSHGALAAKEDGVAEVNRIITRNGNRPDNQMTQMDTSSTVSPTPAMDSNGLMPEPATPPADANEPPDANEASSAYEFPPAPVPPNVNQF